MQSKYIEMATVEDALEIAQIEAESFHGKINHLMDGKGSILFPFLQDYTVRLLKHKNHYTWVLREGGSVKGFIVLLQKGVRKAYPVPSFRLVIDILYQLGLRRLLKAGLSFFLLDSGPKEKNLLHISTLAVKSENRGRGFGKHLLNFAKERAYEKNLSGLSLDVIIENTRAIAFYKREGFIIRKTERSKISERFLGTSGYHFMTYCLNSLI